MGSEGLTDPHDWPMCPQPHHPRGLLLPPASLILSLMSKGTGKKEIQ